MKKSKNQIVKMNLSINKEFYELLQESARKDYMRVSTWTKQFLMKSLLENNSNCKSKTNNENQMEL